MVSRVHTFDFKSRSFDACTSVVIRSERFYTAFVWVLPAIFREFEAVDRDMSGGHPYIFLFFVDVLPTNALFGHIEYHAKLLREGDW